MSKAFICHSGCQNRLDRFVLKSAVDRIFKISNFGAMSVDIRMMSQDILMIFLIILLVERKIRRIYLRRD